MSTASTAAGIGKIEEYLGAELVPGMILTVEPGIYLAAEDLGVRIEDDVLITETGPVVLSSGVPKAMEDIERLMKGLGLSDR